MSTNMEQVNPLYMHHPNLLKHRALITAMGSGEIHKKSYQWIQLNETIFHPKGGGQPCDEGFINGIPVPYVHKKLLDENRIDFFQILHCFKKDQALNFKLGDLVELIVDECSRKIYSKMHTAGHLLAKIANGIFSELEPYQGNHDPKDGYVKFKMLQEISDGKETIKQKIQLELNVWQKKNVPIIETQLTSGMRAIQIDDQVMACGGTHLSNLNEIGNVFLSDVAVNQKEKIVTIKYRVD